MTTRQCGNCALFGHKATAALNHTCVDADPCPKCGGPRMLRVVEVFALGGTTRELTCEGCRRQRRREVA